MPAGSYVKRMPWGQQKPLLGYGIDWSHRLAQGIISCNLFNEYSGLLAKDLANNNNLTLVAGVWHTYGAGQKTIDWTYSTPIITTGDYTILVETYQNAQHPGWLIDDATDTAKCGPRTTLGVFGMRPYPGAAFTNAADTSIVPPAPAMITAQYCGTTSRVCINKYAFTTIATGLTSNMSNSFTRSVGFSTTDRVAYKRKYIYGRAISQDEVTQLYETPYCFIEGWNYGRVYSIPSSAFINSSFWYQNPIMEAI